MEENTFLDYNPQYASMNPNASHIDAGGNVHNDNDIFTGKDDNALSRWWNPQIAEQAAFNRENYFMDKENAFNEYMYNKANEYNSPVEQMKRAKEAGINPLLAASGIMANGNATAVPMQGANGNSPMAPNTANPFEQIRNITSAGKDTMNMINELGKLLGFGKENNATIRQINATANKTAEEADFTRLQKRQFRRTMQIMYDQASKNLEQTEANIKVLQATYEKYQQEKWNTAADTNMKIAQTGETIETTKNIAYKNAEEEFKKIFREIYGVQLNESDMSMLVQAVLGGHGKEIIDGIADCFGQIAKSLGQKIKNNLPTIPKLFQKSTPRTINGMNVKEKEVTQKQWDKDFIKEQKRYWDAHPKVRAYWENKGGFEAFIKMRKEARLNQ